MLAPVRGWRLFRGQRARPPRLQQGQLRSPGRAGAELDRERHQPFDKTRVELRAARSAMRADRGSRGARSAARIRQRRSGVCSARASSTPPRPARARVASGRRWPTPRFARERSRPAPRRAAGAASALRVVRERRRPARPLRARVARRARIASRVARLLDVGRRRHRRRQRRPAGASARPRLEARRSLARTRMRHEALVLAAAVAHRARRRVRATRPRRSGRGGEGRRRPLRARNPMSHCTRSRPGPREHDRDLVLGARRRSPRRRSRVVDREPLGRTRARGRSARLRGLGRFRPRTRPGKEILHTRDRRLGLGQDEPPGRIGAAERRASGGAARVGSTDRARPGTGPGRDPRARARAPARRSR